MRYMCFMRILNRLFFPFENLIKPLDLPISPMPDTGPLQLVWHFAKMFKGILALVFILSTLSALISLATIWALSFIVDGITELGVQNFLDDNKALLTFFLLLFAVIDPLIVFIRSAFMSQTVQTLLPAAIRWQGHKAVESQDMAFFEDIFAGQVASRISQVTGSVQTQLMTAMQTIPRVTIQFVGSFTLLLVLAWQMAIPVFLWIMANGLLAYFIVPKFLERAAKVASAKSKATGAMTEIYNNIAMVKLFAAENSEADSIHSVIGETIDTQHKENRSYILSNNTVHILNAFLIISIFTIGIWGMLHEVISLGELVAGVTVARTLSGSSYAFISLGQSVSRTLGTITDAMPVMTSYPTINDKPDATELKIAKGRIDFKKVTFAYDEKSDPVIRTLDLKVKAGEKLGLIGLSGAGKSTLVALLLRLRDVNDGSIEIDGQDVRDVKQASLRKQIGVVTQDISLLNRSIRDNIRYGRPDATDEEIIQAAKQAEAWEFIENLKDNKGRMALNAFVGDKGVKLSGGQRQRVTIARVLLKDAPVLVLDEATSSLDSEAEAAIQQNLDTMMKDKTTIAIAHRLSTISAMDRLVVMQDGKIIEHGTHDKLVKSGGLYARLWDRQSGGFLGDK